MMEKKKQCLIILRNFQLPKHTTRRELREIQESSLKIYDLDLGKSRFTFRIILMKTKLNIVMVKNQVYTLG